MCWFSVTWEEFLTVSEKLRPWTEQAMKIEVAPWIKDYVANMDELYTNLIIEKIKNRQLNEEVIPLQDYFDLFSDRVIEGELHENVYCERGSVLKNRDAEKEVNRRKGRKNRKVFLDKSMQADRGQVKKILGKGNPGIGKTTLLKKIGWDWAKGIFTEVELLILVLLKLIKPEETIEDAIMAQIPQLEGLGITPKRVKDILDTFGHKCLLILDGLDEHVLGENKDVIKIIKGQKLLNCNVFVTSRPHSTSKVEENFSTIVRVEGFGRTEAAIFAEKLLHDKKKVEMVLNFEPAEFSSDNSLYKSPILLSIMCLLVKEDLIDLTDKQIKVGEIYTRMVRCLYKKYTVRKNKEYTFEGFVKSITLVGKLALKTLLSGDSFMNRKDILEEVGEEAFDYGLLIGHEDAQLLIRDETADIFVTFSHRSIQEFLGAFCFIQLLNEGKTLEMLCGKKHTSKFFLQTPLFVHFCVWLCSGQTYFPFENTEHIRKSLARHVTEQIFPELNVPSFDIAGAYNKSDEIRLLFFGDVLANCNKAKVVVLDRKDPVDWVLTAMCSVLKGIITVHVKGVLHVSVLDRSNIILRIKQWDDNLVNCVLKHCSHITEYPSIHLHINFKDRYRLNLSKLLRAKFKELRIVGSQKHVLGTEGKLRYHPNLTALTFDGIAVKSETLTQLSEANKKSCLPGLSYLSFIRCTGIKSNLPAFFHSPWKKLSYLILYETEIEFSDLQALARRTVLPHLTSLILYPYNDRVNQSQVQNFLQSRSWELLYVPAVVKIYLEDILRKNLKICIRQYYEYLCATEIIAKWNLCTLDISNSFDIDNNLSVLLHYQFASLSILLLSNCRLTSDDLRNLAQASVSGRLPKLKHLDISKNHGELIFMFSNSCRWKKLLRLDITKTHEKHVFEQVRPGYFTSLQEIHFSQYDRWHKGISWSNIRKLYIDDCDRRIFSELLNAVKSGYFSKLETVCVKLNRPELFESDIRAAQCSLAEAGIKCHITSPRSQPYTLEKCVCDKISVHTVDTISVSHIRVRRRMRELCNLFKGVLLFIYTLSPYLHYFRLGISCGWKGACIRVKPRNCISNLLKLMCYFIAFHQDMAPRSNKLFVHMCICKKDQHLSLEILS